MRNYLFNLLFYLLALNAAGQNIDVRGTVSRENGQPLAGASVIAKPGNSGTQTNNKGEFLLANISSTATLIISNVGFQTVEIPLRGKTSVNVTLKDSASALDEVVVDANTGYQKLKPNQINGSVVVVSERELQQQTGTNILQRLNNVTSGMIFHNRTGNIHPESNLRINIRGANTFEGPLNPLIVLDDFIYEGSIDNIHPNDVVSITVLKDASATSIYGARGANGVIVITTRRGKYNQPMKVNASANLIVTAKPNLFHVSQMSTADYLEVEQYLYRNGYFNDLINYDDYYHHPFSEGLQTFIDTDRGRITSADSLARIERLKGYDLRDQLKKYVYREGLTQQYSVNANGGSHNHIYSFGVNYDEVSNVDRSTSRKLNVNIAEQFNITQKFQVRANLYYTNQRSLTGIRTNYTIKSRYFPYLRIADDDGTPLSIPQNYRESFLDSLHPGKLLSWRYKPLEDYKHDRYYNNTEAIMANVAGKYQVTPWLSADVLYQFNRHLSRGGRFADEESYYARYQTNFFTQVDAAGDVSYILPPGGIRNEQLDATTSYNVRGQLSWQHSWKNHVVNGFAGAEAREVKVDGSGFSQYGYQDDPLRVARVDTYTPYPTIIDGSYWNIGSTDFVTRSVNRFVSLYGNILYEYRGRYSLTASARRDGSNIFGASTNNKWKPLWSASAGWDVSEEPFFKSRWIDRLKLKTSIGLSGIVDLTRTALPVASNSTSSLTRLRYTRIVAPYDPRLRWEQTQQLMGGIEFSMFKNVISGSVEYYHKKSTDLYGQTPYDYTAFGRTTMMVRNVASIKGQGIDFILDSRNIQGKFSWNTRLLMNYNTAKTTAYYTESAKELYSLIGGSAYITPVVGMPLYAATATKWGGLDANGNPQGILNGRPSTDYEAIYNDLYNNVTESDQLVYVGKTMPSVSGSLSNTLSWKNLSLTFNVSYSLGYYFRKPTVSYWYLFDYGIASAEYASRWKNPGDENRTDVPSMVYLDYPQFSEREEVYSRAVIHFHKAGHARLNFISVDYKLGKISFWGNASHLGVLWRANKLKLDPEYVGVIPPSRTFAFGVRTLF